MALVYLQGLSLRLLSGKRSLAGLGVLVLTGLVSSLAMSAMATPQNVYYERVLMSEADRRCRLFTAPMGAALWAGRLQARNQAIRLGVSAQDLALTANRAAGRAASLACDAPDLLVAAQKVKLAFQAFSNLNYLTYKGDTANWNARRYAAKGATRWRLSQEVGFGWDRVVFGLASGGTSGRLLAVASFADGARPYAARLVLRDTVKAPQAYLDSRQVSPNGKTALSSRTPPPTAAQILMADIRQTAPSDLLPGGRSQGVMFGWPAQTAPTRRDWLWQVDNLDGKDGQSKPFVSGYSNTSVPNLWDRSKETA